MLVLSCCGSFDSSSDRKLMANFYASFASVHFAVLIFFLSLCGVGGDKSVERLWKIIYSRENKDSKPSCN